MSVLADHQIEALARAGMITPYDDGTKKPGRISSGVSSYGYDMTLGYKFRIFKPYPCTVIDPKKFDDRMLEVVDLTPCHLWSFGALRRDDGNLYSTIVCRNCNKERSSDGSDAKEVCPGHKQADHLLIPPHSFALAETVEWFKIPREFTVIVLGKLTYARSSLIVNCTPMEPEWEGNLTVELSNTAPLPLKIYAGEGIAQAVFLRGDAVCRTSYKDKGGKYQSQQGLTLPKVDGRVREEVTTLVAKPPAPVTRDHHLPPLPSTEAAQSMTADTTCRTPDGSLWRWNPRKSDWVCVARTEEGK